MRGTSTLFAISSLFTAVLLAGCGNSEPDEKDFVTNAQSQLSARDSTVCLNVPVNGDFTSFVGGLTRGWVALLDGPSDSIYRQADTRTKLDALVSAGLARKEAYSLFQNDTAQPATRYFLTDEGHKALVGNRYGSACLALGEWTAKKLVLPRSGVKPVDAPALIRKTTEGDNATYTAWVGYELAGSPAWATNPALSAAYSSTLAAGVAGKAEKVELVQFNDTWVSKQNLARNMTRGAGASDDSVASAATPVEIPADLEAAALAQLNARNNDYSGLNLTSLTIPAHTASETPTGFLAKHPGAVFFAATADAGFQERASKALLAKVLSEQEKALDTLPTEVRARALLEMARRNATVTQLPATAGIPAQSTAQTDRYLNSRQDLREFLDTLVGAGVYVKRDVKKADVEGAEQDGVLYSPVDPSDVKGGQLLLGTMHYSKILKQQVKGSQLDVKVAYELTGRPKWWAGVAPKLPGLAAATSGSRVFTVRPTTDPAFPYTFGY